MEGMSSNNTQNDRLYYTASGFINDVNNLTVGKISAEEAKRREQISQQKRIEAFEKSKKIQRPAYDKKLLNRSRAAEKKKQEAEAEKKKQEAEAEKKKRYDRNLKKVEKMADRRGKTLKF